MRCYAVSANRTAARRGCDLALIGDADAVAEGTAALFNVDGNPIAVAKVDGQLYAFDDTCTHLGCSLSDGTLEGTEITCPCHLSVFQITDGAVAAGPADEPIQTYPVEVIDGQVSVSLAASS